MTASPASLPVSRTIYPGHAIRLAAAAALLLGAALPAGAQAPASLLEAPDISGIAELQQATTVRLGVPALAGATAYRFRAAADPDFRQIVIDTVQRRPLVRIVDLRDGEYHYGVRGVDARGTQGPEALGRFRLVRLPAPPLTDPSAPVMPDSTEPAPYPSPAATQ